MNKLVTFFLVIKLYSICLIKSSTKKLNKKITKHSLLPWLMKKRTKKCII